MAVRLIYDLTRICYKSVETEQQRSGLPLTDQHLINPLTAEHAPHLQHW